MEDARVQAGASDREPRASGAGRDKPPAAQAHSIIDDIRVLSPKARAVMFEALLPGEQPHVVIAGAGGSAIAGTAERIIIVKSGARSGAPLGARAKAFEFESVIGVRLDLETSPAVLAVDAPVKIASCRVYWADSRDNPWKARNAMPVKPPYDSVVAAISALRGLMEAYRDRHPGVADRALREAPDAGVVQALSRSERRSGQADDGAVVSSLPGIGERCPHCRAELRPGWHYCPGCGAPSQSATAKS